MQLRFSVFAIATALTCSTLHQTIACPPDPVSVVRFQATSTPQTFLGDIEDESASPVIRRLAALARTTPEVTAFSTDVEDASFSSYLRELADTTAQRDMIAAIEAIDKAPDVSPLHSFLVDVEDESLSSHFRDADSSSDSALQAVDVRADREILRVAPVFWSNDAELPGADDQDATGSTSAVPLTESIALEGYEDR